MRFANGRVATNAPMFPTTVGVDGIIAEEAVKTLHKLKEGDKPFFLESVLRNLICRFALPRNIGICMSVMKCLWLNSGIWRAMMWNMPITTRLRLRGYSDIPPFESYIDTKHLDEDTQKRLLHAYYACISYTDAQVGKSA